MLLWKVIVECISNMLQGGYQHTSLRHVQERVRENNVGNPKLSMWIAAEVRGNILEIWIISLLISYTSIYRTCSEDPSFMWLVIAETFPLQLSACIKTYYWASRNGIFMYSRYFYIRNTLEKNMREGEFNSAMTQQKNMKKIQSSMVVLGPLYRANTRVQAIN